MAQRAHVLILSQHLASDSHPFRASFVYDQAEVLNEVCDVTIVNLQPSPAGFSVEQQPPLVWERGVPTLQVTYRSVPSVFSFICSSMAILRLIRGMAREGKRPRVVHAHWWAASIPAILACKALGIPLVITEHGSRWSEFRHSRKGLLLGRAVLASADIVLPVSSWLQSVLEEQGVRARMRVVPNIVDVDAFRAPHEPRPFNFNRKTLAIVGRLAPEKGIDDAITALALLHAQGTPCRLEVIGGGGHLDSLRQLSLNEGVGDAVLFHGSLTRSQIVKVFRRVDVLVSATRTSETFGVAVAEGLAAGIPVVATDVGAIPELISRENGILVEPQNPASLAKGIQRALERKWDAGVISKSAERFSRERVLKEILAVYRLLGFDAHKPGLVVKSQARSSED